MVIKGSLIGIFFDYDKLRPIVSFGIGLFIDLISGNSWFVVRNTLDETLKAFADLTL